MDGWMDGRMDGWMEKLLVFLVFRELEVAVFLVIIVKFFDG
jgi:hypothetical protein